MARKAGSKNQFGATAKENMIAVFTRLGGTSTMADWAKDNLTEFYKLYARLVPTEVSGAVRHDVTVAHDTALNGAIDRALGKTPDATLQ